MTAFDLHPRLRAHSHIGAAGWELQTMPEDRPDRPPGAIGFYRRGPEHAWLIEEGEDYALRLADREAAA